MLPLLRQFSTAAALTLDWRAGSGRFALPGPLSAESASGARLTVTPADRERPVLTVLLPSGALESAGRFDIEGGLAIVGGWFLLGCDREAHGWIRSAFDGVGAIDRCALSTTKNPRDLARECAIGLSSAAQ